MSESESDFYSLLQWHEEQRREAAEEQVDAEADISAAEALLAFLHLLLADCNRITQHTPRMLGIRVIAAARLLGLEPFGGKAGRAIAKMVRCSPGLMSHHEMQMADCVGIHFRPSKRHCHRETFRRARLAAIQAGFKSTRKPDWEVSKREN